MMSKHWTVGTPVLTLLLALLAAPVDAQGRGRASDDDRPRASQAKERRPELRKRQKQDERRDDARADRRDDREDRDDERWGDLDWENDDEARGPAFCRNGEGHPVHGRRWCEEKGFGLGGDVWYGDVGWNDSRGGSGSYASAHGQFHDRHDRQCRMRAAERPLDPVWQIRVRTECKQAHDRWHQQAGRGHD